MRLVLASSSPRRREILALLGLPFEVIPPRFDELPSPHRPIQEEVLEFALEKAASVAASRSMVIGSDTMILLGEQKIGKPESVAGARKILRSLAGETHRIFTGVAILDGFGGPGLRTVEVVSVEMRAYSEKEIEDYLACGESLDKAGAYSIQDNGGDLIASIEGDYLAAVGLPLRPIADYLASRGVPIPVDVEKLYGNRAFPNWRSFS